MTDRDWNGFILLLIDIQKGFWWPGLDELRPGFPARIAALLAQCRREGLEIAHVHTRFRADRSDWPPFERIDQGITCVEGTDSVAATGFAMPIASEPVFFKSTLDGMFSRELREHLAARGTHVVITAGLITSVCVLTTTLSAMQHGYITILLEDCCADSREAHEFTLKHFVGYGFRRGTSDRLAESRELVRLRDRA